MKQLVFLAVELYMMIIRTLHSFLFRLIAAAGLLLTSCLTAYADFWEPDSLGEGFERHYAVGPDDYAGKVRCAVVRYNGGDKKSRRGVLYIHGFNDYFFQKEMSPAIASTQSISVVMAALSFPGRSRFLSERSANIMPMWTRH